VSKLQRIPAYISGTVEVTTPLECRYAQDLGVIYHHTKKLVSQVGWSEKISLAETPIFEAKTFFLKDAFLKMRMPLNKETILRLPLTLVYDEFHPFENESFFGKIGNFFSNQIERGFQIQEYILPIGSKLNAIGIVARDVSRDGSSKEYLSFRDGNGPFSYVGTLTKSDWVRKLTEEENLYWAASMFCLAIGVGCFLYYTIQKKKRGARGKWV